MAASIETLHKEAYNLWFNSVAVITSALLTKGLGFKPQRKHVLNGTSSGSSVDCKNVYHKFPKFVKGNLKSNPSVDI